MPLLDGNQAATLINSTKNGKLFEVVVPQNGTNTTSSFMVLHLWGTAYEKGQAQGQLLAKVLPAFLNDVWSYLESVVESGIDQYIDVPQWLKLLIADVGLDLALDATELAARAFSGDYFYDELKGMCDAVNMPDCYSMAVRVHMLAGLTQGHCSLFGSWGAASLNGHTLQSRQLDWNMDGPFRDYPMVTVYHANGPLENNFAMVGMTGFIGALTGMSDHQLGISEIGVSYPDATFGDQSRIGIPFIFMLRDILQFDHTIDDALSRMADQTRTCDLILGVGDGNLGYVRGVQYSYSVVNIMDDLNMRPVNQTWHFRIPEMVYFGMDWLCGAYNLVLGTQLKANWGTLTLPIAIRDVIGVEGSGDVHAAVYDLTTNQLAVSFASPHGTGGCAQAYCRQFTVFDTLKLFAEPQP